MKSTCVWRFLAASLCLVLPACGLLLRGTDIAPYLEFPPCTRYIGHAPFSGTVFAALLVAELAFVVALLRRIARSAWQCLHPAPAPTSRFPRWGWAGVACCALSWLLAWTRLPHAADLQPYTFIPLWLSYIVVMNALAQRRNGTCPLRSSPRRYLMLFPASAAFWWYFEYLNRFVQNWFYQGVEGFGPVGYVVHASLAFSTVLPAIEATAAWLSGYPVLTAGLDGFQPWRPTAARHATRWALAIGALALLLLPFHPNALYPFLWLAPLAVLAATESLAGRATPFRDGARGDWRPAIRYALAALMCGFVWELWNYGSHARWIYAVPYVGRYHLFEMPILGFAGYLPFGIECAIVAGWLMPPKRERVQA